MWPVMRGGETARELGTRRRKEEERKEETRGGKRANADRRGMWMSEADGRIDGSTPLSQLTAVC